MRIALDARTVFARAQRGTAKNLIDLYRHMAAMRPAWRFVMYHRGPCTDDPFADLENVRQRRIEIKGDRWHLWREVRLPLACWCGGAGLLHCPANWAPRHPLVPMVVTIHDLIPLDPRSGFAEPETWQRSVASAARKAGHIITPSAFSKRLIVERLGVSEEKVTVNPWAPDGRLRKVTDRETLNRVRARYGLAAERPYVFGFGADSPLKNTPRVIEAWAHLPASLRSEYAMVLVGIHEPALTRFRKRAEDLGTADSLFLHDFVPEEDIPMLLSGAAVLCYASLSEGFGLPILDAFLCDVAVLTSNVTSLPEVAGDAALVVDPTDRESITHGLEDLLKNPSLCDELVRRGRMRLKAFSWEACARRVCAVFESVLGETG